MSGHIRTTVLALAFAIACGFAGYSPAEAQGRFSALSVGLNGGWGSPSGSFEEGASLRAGSVSGGMAVGISLGYELARRIEAYAGYSRQSFDHRYSGSIWPVNTPYEAHSYLIDSGLSLGARVSLSPETGANPWIRGGVLAHRLAREWSDDPQRSVVFSKKEEWAMGLEVGSGFSIPVSRGLSLGPGITYRTYSWSRALERDPTPRVTYLRVELATRYRFQE